MIVTRPPILALLVTALMAAFQSAWCGEVAGQVSRLVGEAVVRRAGTEVSLAVGTDVRSRDLLATSGGSRLEVVFADDTVLTLSEATQMVVHSWMFAPDEGAGNLSLRLVSGAFSARAGRIAELPGSPMHVRLPVATIGIRGTHFWAGPMDGQFGVLLIEGGIYVENVSGRVDLTQAGDGIFLPPPDPAVAAELVDEAADWTGPDAPPARGGPASPPTHWPTDRFLRALATVSFHE